MRSIRNTWLAAMSSQQFQKLNPWDFVIHPESLRQWVAEIRTGRNIRLKDDEVLSILYPGLHKTVEAAIRTYGDKPAEGRGYCLIGSALQYVRIHGIADVIEEIPGSNSINVAELDTIEQTPRAHALQHEYMRNSSNFNEGFHALPQFLSDGIVLSDEALQALHQNIERVRAFLRPREHQILRLSVLEQQIPADMSDILGLTKKQVWKVHRALNKRLSEIAIDQGACPTYIASIRRKATRDERSNLQAEGA